MSAIRAARRRRGPLVATTVIALSIPAVLWLQLAGWLSYREAFTVNLLLLAALALAMALLDGSLRRPRPLLRSRRQLALFALLVAGGLVMRTACWTRYPPADGQLWEEAQMATLAQDSLLHHGLDSFFPLPDLIAESGIAVVGSSLTAVRIPFLLLGIASVALFFAAARLALRDFFAAFFAGGLFAASAMLAGSSRIALETMSPIFTVCLALAAVFYARGARGAGTGAIAGIASGLLLTEYDAYRIVPVFLFLFLLAAAFQDCPRPLPVETGAEFHWRRFAPLLTFGLFTAAVIIPQSLVDPEHPLFWLTDAYARHGHALAEQHAALSWFALLAEQAGKVRTTAGFLFLQGNSNDVLPETMGVLELFTGVAATLALLYCGLRARHDALKLFLIASVTSIVVLGGILVGNPARYRMLPAVPLALLATGVPVDDLLGRLGSRRRAAIALLSVLLLVLAGLNARAFFAVAIRDPLVREEFYDLNLVLADEIRKIEDWDPAAQIFLVSDRDFLGEQSDYSFFFDPRRVAVTTAVEKVAGDQGYVVSHGPFIPLALRIQGLRECRQWRARQGFDELLRCRLDRTAG